MMKFKLNYGLLIALCLVASMASADSLELKNGSLVKGKFMGKLIPASPSIFSWKRMIG